MNRFALATLFLVGCSSSTTTADSAPAPLAYDFSPGAPDVKIGVIANLGAERIVQGYFAVGGTLGDDCKVSEVVEGCALRTCVIAGATGGTPIDLGSVSVTSPSLGTVSLAPSESERYARVVQMGDFVSDESVQITSTGTAAVAAFTLEAKLPKVLTPLSIGNCSTEANCVLSDAAPVAKWTGGGDIVMVVLRNTQESPEINSLSCAFDGTKGAGQIPASAMAKLTRKGSYRVSINTANNTVVSGQVRFSAQRISFGHLENVKLPE